MKNNKILTDTLKSGFSYFNRERREELHDRYNEMIFNRLEEIEDELNELEKIELKNKGCFDFREIKRNHPDLKTTIWEIELLNSAIDEIDEMPVWLNLPEPSKN